MLFNRIDWRLKGAVGTVREVPRALATLVAMSAGEHEVEVDPGEVAAWLGAGRELTLVDVREPYEREAGHIEGSRHIELTELSGRAGELERDRAIVFYCRVGNRSAMAAAAFRASGYEAYTMRGGLVRWAEEGRELSPRDGHVAKH
jgi:rhodanese-related sulfurtransferase